MELKDEIRELRRKIQILNVIIEEGDEVIGGLQSKFWLIIKRTLLNLQESYKAEAYEAIKSVDKNPGPFLGRMEMVDHVIQIMESNFTMGRDNAIVEHENCLKRISEIQDILDKKDGLGYTGSTGEI